jgi:tetratricopeptide (TPR) repeat protein
MQRFEYIYGPGRLSWTEYKQLNEIVDATLVGIDTSVREAALEIVEGSDLEEVRNTLESYHVAFGDLNSILGQISEAQNLIGGEVIQYLSQIEQNSMIANNTLAHLRLDVAETTSAVRALAGVVALGLSVLASEVSESNRKLAKIQRVLQSPERTWAAEQFNTALDLAHRGFLKDGTKFAKLSVFGNQMHTGYVGDCRYHMLLGRLHLGLFPSKDGSSINLEAAEESFIQAEKYANEDEEESQALAALHASFAAYAKGQITSALEHARRAHELCPHDSEILYHLARYEAHQDGWVRARELLAEAILIDWVICKRVLNDGEFFRREGWLSSLLKGILEALQSQGVSSKVRLENACQSAKDIVEEMVPEMQGIDLIGSANRCFFGYDEVYLPLGDAHHSFNSFVAQWRQSCFTFVHALGRIGELTADAEKLLQSGSIESALHGTNLLCSGYKRYVEAVREIHRDLRDVGDPPKEIKTLVRAARQWLQDERHNYQFGGGGYFRTESNGFFDVLSSRELKANAARNEERFEEHSSAVGALEEEMKQIAAPYAEFRQRIDAIPEDALHASY